MNIEDAIAAGTQAAAGAKCRLGRWVEQIPADTAGLVTLELILETNDRNSPYWRTLEQIDAILRRLGCTTSNKTVANHRNKVCRCFQ